MADELEANFGELIEDPVFKQAVNLVDAGDTAGLRALLDAHRCVVHQQVKFAAESYFESPTLLEFVAENPVRHGKLPPNIVEIARLILEAGPSQTSRNNTLELVATGRVPRECQVQIPLIELLCDSGADPDLACNAAAAHGELEALHKLLECGAKLTLPIAVALGDEREFARLLGASKPEERHLALAIAAQFGHVETARALLDAGEDPDRFNPPGAHRHSTPLHQAAWAGHQELVRLLVERGARLDIKDLNWNGTPADWDAYSDRTEIERYLREHGV